MHGTRLTALTTDKWWAEEENKFQRFSSSSDKIKLNKRDEREENLCFGEKEKEKPKQQCCKLSLMSGAAQRLLHVQPFSTISEATCEWIFLFSAPEMFSLLSLSRCIFIFPRVFHSLLFSFYSLQLYTCWHKRKLSSYISEWFWSLQNILGQTSFHNWASIYLLNKGKSYVQLSSSSSSSFFYLTQ